MDLKDRGHRFLGLAVLCGFVALLDIASTASAVTVVNAPRTLAAGATGMVRFDAGSGSRACEFVARSGANRLGPLRYKISHPIVMITGRVPRTPQSLTWRVSLRCASSKATVARGSAATALIRVQGHKKGRPQLFASGTVKARSYPLSTVIGAQEPELPRGGKGGYDCASADNGGKSVLDGSSYCTGYCTWFVWQKRPEPQLKDLGNAFEWYGRAKAKGIPVGSAPAVGAVAWWGVSAYAPEGHVAYVTGVTGSSVTIEEMNRIAWNVADTRTVAGGELPTGYIYGGPAGNGSGSGSAPSPRGGGATPGGGALPALDGSPATIVERDGSLDIIAVGANGHLYQFNRNPSTYVWAGYDITAATGGGDTVTGSPSAIYDPDGGLDLLADGTNGHLFQFHRDPNTFVWTGYDLTAATGGGDTVTGGTAAIIEKDNSLDVIAIGTNGHLYQFNRNPSTYVWAGYDITAATGGGDTVTGSPSAIYDPDGGLDLLADGTNGHLFQFHRDPNTFVWTGYDLTAATGGGDTVTGGTAAIIEKDNSLDVIAIGTNGHLYQFNRNPSTYVWAGYDITAATGGGDTVTGSPSAIYEQNGSLDLLADGTNNHLFQFNRDPGTFVWTGYDLTAATGGGDTVTGGTAAVYDPGGGLDVMAIVTNGHVFQFNRNPGTFVWTGYDITAATGGGDLVN